MNLQHGSWLEHLLLFLGAWVIVSAFAVAILTIPGWLYSKLHNKHSDED